MDQFKSHGRFGRHACLAILPKIWYDWMMGTATPNTIPRYEHGLSYERQFPAFFEWALALEDPAHEIPLANKHLGLPIKPHPLGFTVYYLSPAYEGVRTQEVTGLIRANIYPEGKTVEQDVHAHGFDSISGVVQGELTSYVYEEDEIFSGTYAEAGEGWTAYENRTDAYGNNHSQRMTDAVIRMPPPSREIVVRREETYTQQHGVEYHRVVAKGLTITIFAKSASKFDEHDSRGIVLRPPGHTPPPEQY